MDKIIKVKICGLTNKTDVDNAVKLGADMLGFILYKKSKRFIELNEVKNIIKDVPRNILKVGVFVNEKIDILKDIINKNIFDILQLHGTESPSYCDELKSISIFKAFGLNSKKDLNILTKYKVAGYLLDTHKKGKFGGTGKTFDWELAKEAKKIVSPIILSGGLNPYNIFDAINIVDPWAVDVSSGVEKSPGKKDKEKMKQFIKIVKAHKLS
jgi:phosphoribosylanthranilate isomerase